MRENILKNLNSTFTKTDTCAVNPKRGIAHCYIVYSILKHELLLKMLLNS